MIFPRWSEFIFNNLLIDFSRVTNRADSGVICPSAPVINKRPSESVWGPRIRIARNAASADWEQ